MKQTTRPGRDLPSAARGVGWFPVALRLRSAQLRGQVLCSFGSGCPSPPRLPEPQLRVQEAQILSPDPQPPIGSPRPGPPALSSSRLPDPSLHSLLSLCPAHAGPADTGAPESRRRDRISLASVPPPQGSGQLLRAQPDQRNRLALEQAEPPLAPTPASPV
ncbi:hypothetical protein MDA_GLEAN10014221 [Myotis davidii]|uniref:Uncharacterized protein n=1 Tax=Myotis davidii TaxID=225400 RepID=L5MFL1_MYODS|nr:hypothetical protein MDA_GLEAN10014221 [Myotis davidii]